MPEHSPPKTALNILIVDDDINIRRTLAMCLESDGHSVVSVSNRRDAVDQASRKSFELAFVDLRLGLDVGLICSLSYWRRVRGCGW